MRRRRRRLLGRAFLKRRQLRAVVDRTPTLGPDDILAFATVRNEADRLPWFLDHHRRLGVTHFIFVDNDSDDGTGAFLSDQPDCSVWHTSHSYKLSRFGLDWITWLMIRHGHGRWCLVLDADELFIYPHWPTRPLSALTERLDQTGTPMMGALMLDLYPQGPVGDTAYRPRQDPLEILTHFDAGNYSIQVQRPMKNLWVQGGARARAFFGDEPRRAPTLQKVPLVRWHWRYVYVNSTHALLPPRLNRIYGEGETLSGVLLHTKFLDSIVKRSAEERLRQEHFANSDLYNSYYESLTQNPSLWCEASTPYRGWRALEGLGVMSRGDWV
ncbi:glycosyltransferase family 2 protein [Palleronia caenipelagi]|uniref:Glycosyltransferase family 2 protein n=1 Tax=Palleronia caenipelagi TaxID=2489174 RepID=A0A547Q8J1_9RHOB|nr:glycosyltransferase family 2 protein [Palleronia caenipelagi]TRD22696.1 glycosyltransferase family 2 protein [Palleronia caenipelagi]